MGRPDAIDDLDEDSGLTASEELLLDVARTPELSPLPMERERIAHFRILRVLGQGGMGVVYAALDERLRRIVALKILRVAEEREKKRFLREARAASATVHANIASVYEIGEANGVAFI